MECELALKIAMTETQLTEKDATQIALESFKDTLVELFSLTRRQTIPALLYAGMVTSSLLRLVMTGVITLMDVTAIVMGF